MENPLKSLGISSISVENSGEDATPIEFKNQNTSIITQINKKYSHVY